jgi:hypothetical protein
LERSRIHCSTIRFPNDFLSGMLREAKEYRKRGVVQTIVRLNLQPVVGG